MPAAANKMPRATKVLVGTSLFISQKIRDLSWLTLVVNQSYEFLLLP